MKTFFNWIAEMSIKNRKKVIKNLPAKKSIEDKLEGPLLPTSLSLTHSIISLSQNSYTVWELLVNGVNGGKFCRSICR